MSEFVEKYHKAYDAERRFRDAPRRGWADPRGKKNADNQTIEIRREDAGGSREKPPRKRGGGSVCPEDRGIMNEREAIERIRDHMEVHRIEEYPHIKLVEALNMAIDALRGQQDPVKLDRSRWEKCRGCDLCKNDYAVYHIFPYYKFCPMCGRPLTEEAWAELERRI